MPDIKEPPGKNIVLFSDGTGNSASKPFKTNVWRTYQALDLHNSGPVQVAYYRDGVGTETFKPLAVLGGAFGLGVMREVRQLYVFLCRNYREGDRIYAFGFSRGAFTIRLLVGLVSFCGLVRADSENQLFHLSRAAYRAFRRDFLRRAAEARGSLAFKAYTGILPPPRYVAGSNRKQADLELTPPPARPQIEFLGLWDTVDAYGMPVEEMKQGIDQWVWPMSLADRKLSTIVKHACHALSLDDERPSFRPVLWDESDPRDKARIEQVWFAGVHANVGGGYPIDDLSFVPLVWMLKKASDAGLRFFDDQLRFFEEMQNVHGTAYDSRSGLAGYYRYGPRSLQKLCADTKNKVTVDPVIHASVAERIARRHRCYAPISIPSAHAVLDPDTKTPVLQNDEFVKLAWDIVFWRRITYFATVALTLLLVASPFLFGPEDPGLPCKPACAKETPGTFAAILPPPLGWLADKLLGFIPAWTAPWVDVLKQHYVVGPVLIALVAWLFFCQSDRLKRNISERSEYAWAKLKGIGAGVPTSPWTDQFIRKLRLSPTANRIGKFYDEILIPNLVGVLIWLAIVATIWRLAVWIGRKMTDAS